MLVAGILLNIVVAILAALELFLLSERQKAWIAHQAVRLWDWLDEIKKNSLLSRLRRSRRWIVGTAVFLAACYVVWMFKTRNDQNESSLVFDIGFIVLLLVGGWYGSKIIYLTLNASTLLGTFLRATLFACLILLPFYGVVTFMSYFKEVLTPGETAETVTLFKMFTVMIYIVTTLFTGLMLIFWAVVTVLLAFIYALTGILIVSEYVVRRIAEYSRPILAVSLLFGVVLTGIKVFT